MRLFATEVCQMLPLVLAFLDDVVVPKGVMADDIKCFRFLAQIMSLLMTNSDITDAVFFKLESVVDQHRALFVKLYSDLVKIKFHHEGHLPYDLWRLGKSISCFPCERKHRDYKRIVLHTFRSVEHTVTTDFVNYAVQECVTGRFRFEAYWLEDPLPVNFGGVQLQMGFRMHTPIGEIWNDDVVYCQHDTRSAWGAWFAFFTATTITVPRSAHSRPWTVVAWIGIFAAGFVALFVATQSGRTFRGPSSTATVCASSCLLPSRCRSSSMIVMLA